jgi:hypothetical protein
MGIFSKSKAKPMSRAEALENFKISIRTAIDEARAAGLWPGTLRDYLESHASNLNAQEHERAYR